MTFGRLVLQATAVASSTVASFTNAADEQPRRLTDLHLFLLANQSNMAGRGAVEQKDLVPHARVLTLRRELAWKPAVDPLHWDKPEVAGVAVGTTFADC